MHFKLNKGTKLNSINSLNSQYGAPDIIKSDGFSKDYQNHKNYMQSFIYLKVQVQNLSCV